MTRFQKVASALRGGPERDEQDQAAQAADPQARQAGPPWVTQQDEAAMAKSPISRQAQRQGDYWDEPAASAAERDEAVAATTPDVPVPATGTDPLARQDQVTGQACRTPRITRRLSRTCSAPPRTQATGPRQRRTRRIRSARQPMAPSSWRFGGRRR